MRSRPLLAAVVTALASACPAPAPPATSAPATSTASSSPPSSPSSPGAAAHGPRWRHDDVDGALAAARAAGRVVFVDAWAPWCHTCLSMQREVLEQPALAALADRVEFVAVDTDRVENAAFLARFPVSLWPTFFVLDPARPDGPPLAVHPGSGTLDEMLALVQAGLAALTPDDTTRRLDEALAAVAVAGTAGNDIAAVAAAWDKALALAPAGHPRRGELLRRAAWARVKGDPAACVAFIEAHRAEVTMGGAPGDLEAALLSCAGRLDGDAQRKAREGARARLRALVQTPPVGAAVDDRADTMATLADLEETLGDHAAAVALHEQRLRLLEDDEQKATTEKGAQVHDYARLNSLLFLGRGDDAVALLQARAKALPDDYEPPARLASALFRLKRHDEAKVAATTAIDKSYGPRRLRYLLLLADIEAARGDATAARAALQRLVDEGAALPETMRPTGLLDDARSRLAKVAP
jgi:thiol-disulfide isomerase/thioredoxin